MGTSEMPDLNEPFVSLKRAKRWQNSPQNGLLFCDLRLAAVPISRRSRTWPGGLVFHVMTGVSVVASRSLVDSAQLGPARSKFHKRRREPHLVWLPLCCMPPLANRCGKSRVSFKLGRKPEVTETDLLLNLESRVFQAKSAEP